MQDRNKSFNAVCAAVPVFVGGLFAPAMAGTPSALAHVPAGTPIYIAIPDMGGLLGDLSALQRSLVGKLPPEAAAIGMGLFFAQTLTTQPGFETNGSAVIIVDPEGGEPGPFGEPQPAFTAILPIGDLEAFAGGAFMAGQGAKLQNGILTTSLPNGETFYLRDIGTHSVASNDMSRVRAFEAGDWLGGHTAALGRAGLSAMESGDLVLVADINSLKGQISQMMNMAEMQVNFLAMMGGGDQVMQGFNAFRGMMNALQRDGSVGMVSFDVGEQGIAIDLGASFREGTPSAEMFAARGDTTPLMRALPSTDFLVAYAFDASSDDLRGVIENAAAMLPMMGGEADFGVKSMLEHADGFSGLIGSSPAAFAGAGFLARQINYIRCDDSKEVMGTMRSMVEKLHGQAMMGMTYETSYESGSAEVAGVKVDTYSIKTKTDPAGGGGGMMMMDPSMIQNMMYGMAGGPTGYIANVEGGFYTTTSKNSELLGSAFEASKGGASFAGSDRVRRVSDRLHDGRVMEAYLSLDQVYNSFAPMAQMFGLIDHFEPIAAMSPLGMSVKADGGGLMGRVFIPSDVLGVIAEFAQEMDMGMGMPMFDEPAEDPDF